LGVGTIFQAKARASDHWSTSPRVVISVDAPSECGADPAGDDDDSGDGFDTTLDEREFAQSA
jgi:hypothetical protein